MCEAEFLKELRGSIGDTEEPYTFSDSRIMQTVEEGVLFYSRYRPARKIGVIYAALGMEFYPFADDYQTWTKGLEEYQVLDRAVWIPGNLSQFEIRYEYLANRTFSEIPPIDLPLVLEYCQGSLIEYSLLEKQGAGLEEPISALKLGKGLDLSFDTAETLRKELLKIAAEKKAHFFCALKSGLAGGWY